jgi:hypothetical protein
MTSLGSKLTPHPFSTVLIMRDDYPLGLESRGLSLPRGDGGSASESPGVPAPRVRLFRSFSCSMRQVSSGHTPVITSFLRSFRGFRWLSWSREIFVLATGNT